MSFRVSAISARTQAGQANGEGSCRQPVVEWFEHCKAFIHARFGLVAAMEPEVLLPDDVAGLFKVAAGSREDVKVYPLSVGA